MNAPSFDITRIKNAYGSSAWVNEMIAEETRCCESIDARTTRVEDESLQLHTKMGELEKRLQDTCGFFARWSLRSQMKRIAKQMEWRRLVLIELYEARIRRTMTW